MRKTRVKAGDMSIGASRDNAKYYSYNNAQERNARNEGTLNRSAQKADRNESDSAAANHPPHCTVQPAPDPMQPTSDPTRTRQARPEAEPIILDAVPVEGEWSTGSNCQEPSAAQKAKGAAQIAAGGALAAVGVPMLILPGPGAAAILGGAALASKGQRNYTGREATPLEEKMDDAAAKAAAAAEEAAKKSARKLADRVAEEAPKALGKAKAAAESLKQQLNQRR